MKYALDIVETSMSDCSAIDSPMDRNKKNNEKQN